MRKDKRQGKPPLPFRRGLDLVVFSTLTPRLSYGRHYGPAPTMARPAAVLLLAYPDHGTWKIPLIVRPETMADHAGQISLPGGVVESGETSEACALREYEEELGALPEGFEVLGTLSPLWVFVSNFQVTPYVAITSQRPQFQPNPSEVAEVIEFPLSALFDPAARGSHVITRRALQFSAPHFSYAGHKIWGATCLILAEFADLISDRV